MNVIDPGHMYQLEDLDSELGSPLSYERQPTYLEFVKRMGPQYPGNTSAHAGTNMQEVLRVLIDRATYLNKQIPCAETEAVIHHLRSSLLLLELRAARRHGRVLPIHSYEDIEIMSTCAKCGHIGCGGSCH